MCIISWPEKNWASIWSCQSSYSAPSKARQVARLDDDEEEQDREECGGEEELGGDRVPDVAELDGGVVAGETASYGRHQPAVHNGEDGDEHCKGGEEGHEGEILNIWNIERTEQFTKEWVDLWDVSIFRWRPK